MNSFYLSPEGGRYYLGTQFSYEGRIYYGTEETFSLLGFTEVTVQQQPNPVYYNVYGVNDDGSWDYTEKTLSDVQKSLVDSANSFSHSTLSPTDWYVIRETENGTPVPVEYNSYREAVRQSCDLYVSSVNSAPDVPTIENTIGATPVLPFPPGNSVIGIYVEGLAESDLLTVLGTYDPSAPGSYVPLTEIQYGQLGIGMYVNKFGSVVDGKQIIAVNPGAGTLQLDTPLSAGLAATAPSFDWVDAPDLAPYGIINTGRGGTGQAGPLDLNLSYFVEIHNLGDYTEEDLELYVPGNGTVIPYSSSMPAPYHFDSLGNCFVNGDWRLTIRIADSNYVIATITVPQGNNTNVSWTYNNTIPSLGGGSSHSA
jgi:hypothetical protein